MKQMRMSQRKLMAHVILEHNHKVYTVEADVEEG